MTITSGLRYFISKASTSCCMMKTIRLSNTARTSTTTVKALFSTNKGEKMKTHVLSSTFIENNNVHMCNDNYYYNYHQTRHLGRKAGRMGKHLETLNEIAHRDEHEKAKERRNKHKKQGKGVQNNVNSPTNEIPPMEEDETETIFDHGGNDDNDDGGDDNTPSLPDINDVRTRMMKVVDTMEVSFKAIRGAEATPELFDSVQVKAYGTMTPLNGIGQVVINSPTRATITCFDPEVAPAVRDAVRDMTGMNFNPMVEDGVVIVPIPRVSAETRKVRKNLVSSVITFVFL